MLTNFFNNSNARGVWMSINMSWGTFYLPELAVQTGQLLVGVGPFKDIAIQNVSHSNVPKMVPVIQKTLEGQACNQTFKFTRSATLCKLNVSE